MRPHLPAQLFGWGSMDCFATHGRVTSSRYSAVQFWAQFFSTHSLFICNGLITALTRSRTLDNDQPMSAVGHSRRSDGQQGFAECPLCLQWRPNLCVATNRRDVPISDITSHHSIKSSTQTRTYHPRNGRSGILGVSRGARRAFPRCEPRAPAGLWLCEAPHPARRKKNPASAAGSPSSASRRGNSSPGRFSLWSL